MSYVLDMLNTLYQGDELAWLQLQGATSNYIEDAWNELLTSNGYSTYRQGGQQEWLKAQTGIDYFEDARLYALENDLYAFLPTPILDFNGDPANITESGTGADNWSAVIGGVSFVQATDGNRPDKATRGVDLTRANGDFMQITGGVNGLKHGVSDFALALKLNTNYVYTGINAVVFTTGGLHNTAQGFAIYVRADNKLIFTCKAYIGSNNSIASDAAIIDGSDHSVICQRIGGISKMWIDGVEQAETLDTSAINVSWNGSYPDHLLGKRHASSTWNFDGNIKDLICYETGQTLTDAQVASLTAQIQARG